MRLDAFGFVVNDMEKTLAFYRTLGLEFGEPEGEGHIEAEIDGGIRLMFDTAEIVQSFSDWQPPTGGGRRMSLAFLCDSPTDVDDRYAMIIEAGHHGEVEPFDAVWGQRYATVHDPDGNPVDLFARLPDSEG